MPTSEERREVARKLREYARCEGAECLVYCEDFGETVLNLFTGKCGESFRANYEYLADLIDTEPERACHVVATERKVSQMQTMVSKSCSFCGYVFGSEEHRPFLPGAGDEIVLGDVSIPNYCPNCGARVIDA